MLIIEILFFKFEKFIPLNIPFFQPLNEKMAFHKFSPCKYVANMWKLRNKYRARTMVNATFAYQKTGGYNNEAGRKFVQIHFFSSGESLDLKFPRSMNCYIGAIFM